jgi:hypothetical protein
MTKTEGRNDKLREAHEKLQQAVAEIVFGDDWKRMLKVASRFHRYSFNNHQVEAHSIGPPSVGCDRVRQENVLAHVDRASPQ